MLNRVSGRWGFRVATRSAIGGGHVSRCVALAAALGHGAHFFVDPDCIDSARLKEYGFSVIREQSAEHADEALAALYRHEINGLVVDGPTFGALFTDNVTKIGICLEIDDGNRASVAQIVVRPNFLGDDLKTAQDQVIAAGPTYALLNPRFAATHVLAKGMDPAPTVRRILIAAGAFDSPNLTKLALTAVAITGNSVPVTVVLGGQAPHLAEIKDIAAGMPNVTLRIDVKDMAAMYLDHDLCIGAPGVSLLERSSCGLPSILASQSTAQEANAEAAAKLGCARHLGNCKTLAPHILADTLDQLIRDNDERLEMRAVGLHAVDGRGAGRVAELMTAFVQRQTA